MMEKQEFKAFCRWTEGATRKELEDKLRQLQVLVTTLTEEEVIKDTNRLIREIRHELTARDEVAVA